MFTTPGKKLLFMGDEIGQPGEWSHESEIPFHLLDEPAHGGISRLVGDLNRVYAHMGALHDLDTEPAGFEWAVANDSSNSVLAYLRRSREGAWALVVHNMTPVPRHGYRVGVPAPGRWEEVLNTDAAIYGGSGQGNFGGVEAVAEGPTHHGRPWSVELSVPPLASLIFEPATPV
jgi:1,4-alpha-glucan branching enzyme